MYDKYKNKVVYVSLFCLLFSLYIVFFFNHYLRYFVYVF